jgi:hypothetical protein
MTDHQEPGKGIAGFLYTEALVPVLAFGGTLAGIALYNAGMLPEIQYGAIGGFLASCLLATLAWNRLHKDIVAISTPIYGFIFLVTPIDFTGGVVLQLIYACGLTVLAARLRYRFGPGIAGGSWTKDLAPGPVRDYVESTRSAFEGQGPACGHAAALAFYTFAEGDYAKAADLAHAASCTDGMPGQVVRAFSILRQHAELLERDEPRPVTFLKFLPDDAVLLAKSSPVPDDPDKEFDLQMDNSLLLLYSAAWHASPEDRPALLSLEPFAQKLIGT